MNKLYQRINWQNYPSDSTPLNESNLNKMDAAVDGIDDRVVTLDVTKLPVATANTMVKDVTFNETTGVFTITKLNGTKVTVNTALEKIATNFRFDHSTQKLILTLIDGTTQEVDLSALLTQYEFLNSSTIQFTIDSSGKVKASVVNGSITGDMLEPNYLANVTLQASKADTSAKNAKESEEKAAEYAESAKNSADSAEPVASTATGANPTIQDSTNAPIIYGKFKGYTLQDGTPTPDAPIEIEGLDKVSVKTCGKNLINDSDLIGKTGVIDSYHEVKLKPNITYYFVAKTTSGDGINIGYFGTYLLDENNNRIVEYINQTGKYISEFTLTEEQANSIVKCRITANGSQPTDMVMTEVALAETPVYAPYTETLAEIDLAEPLYEGDYIEYRADGTGVLHKKFMNFNPTTIEAVAENVGAYIKLIKGYCKTRSTALCNYLKLDATGQTTGFNFGGNAEGNFSHFFIKVLGLTTKEEYQSWLNEHSDLEVVYELAEPTETPLTAEQVEQFKQLYTFEPVTNVLCDGEVEIRYYKANDNGETVGMLQGMVEKSNETVGMLQEMVEKSNETVGMLQEMVEKSNETVGMLQNCKVILLTDSYGVVNGDNSWCYKFAEYLGLVLNKDIFISAIESTGFHSNCLYTFTGNLKNMSIPEPNKITDVVVCGGMNDVYYNTESELLSVPNAIASFVYIAKNKFPNAQIRIGFIGNSYNNTYIGNKNDTNNTPIQKAILMYKQCVKYGAKYLNNVEYCLRNNSLFIDDMVHPNADGAQWLAQYVANSFLNGSADINAMNLLGITWESDIAYKENFNLYTYLDNNVCGIILNPTDFNAQISNYPNKRSLPITVNTMYDYKLGVLTNSFIIGSWNGFNRANIDICASLFTSNGINNIVRLSASLVVSAGNLYISFIVPDEYVGGYINGIFLNQCNLMCDTLNN